MKKIDIILLVSFLFIAASCGNRASDAAPNKSGTTVVAQPAKTDSMKTVLFFGNSLTAGYGLDPAESFPSLIRQRIDSLQLPFKVVNAGVSGETSAGGNGRIDWILKQPVDVFVLELGANDGLRGIPLAETTKNLQSIIDKVKAKYPEAKLILAGMEVPPNMGGDYAKGFHNMFPELAKRNRMALIPFLLEGVAGNRELNQGDGIHPTADGAKIVTNTVWKTLKDELE